MLNEAAYFETVLISELHDAPAERMVCFVGALAAARGGGGGGGGGGDGGEDDDGYIITLRDGSGSGSSGSMDAVRVDTRDVIVPVCAPLALLRVHGVTRGGGGVPLVRATVLCSVEELDLAGWRSMLILRRAVLARQGLLEAGSLGAKAVAAEAAAAAAQAQAPLPAPAPAFVPPAGAGAVSAHRARGRAAWPIAAAGDGDSQSSSQPQSAETSAPSPPAAEAPRTLRSRPPRGGGSRHEHAMQPLADT